MENASKALIIAASVLIAIMIIALGVTIFNKAQDSADTTSLDITEINMFNQKFERYSDKQLGSQVKSLISFAISNASTNSEEPSKLPTVILQVGRFTSGNATGGTTASNNINNYIDTLSGIRNNILSTHSYNIVCGYGKTGLIDVININTL